jgi:hypothetical protein
MLLAIMNMFLDQESNYCINYVYISYRDTSTRISRLKCKLSYVDFEDKPNADVTDIMPMPIRKCTY